MFPRSGQEIPSTEQTEKLYYKQSIDTSVCRDKTSGQLTAGKNKQGEITHGDTTRLGFIYQSKT